MNNNSIESRPKWSICIPSYNCRKYINETLDSVVSQITDSMHVQVVDDCSTDGIEEALEQYNFSNFNFYRQQKNVGHIKNFETCISLAKGEYIHLLHGDDYVLPGFYEEAEGLFAKYPEAGAVICNGEIIDGNGKMIGIPAPLQKTAGHCEGFYHKILYGQQVLTPCIIVRRKVYEHLGTFRNDLLFTEDWEMWARIAKNYPIVYTPKVLAGYRMHQQSQTGRTARAGADLKDLQRITQIFCTWEPELAPNIRTAHAENQATHTLHNAYRLWNDHGKWWAAVEQLRLSWLLTRKAATRKSILRFFGKEMLPLRRPA